MEEVDELAVALRHDIGKYIRHRIVYPVEQDARNKTIDFDVDREYYAIPTVNKM